jgi:hypothetical protein
MREGSSANAPTNSRCSKSALSDLPDDHDRGGWLRRGARTENVRMSAMRTRSKARSFGPKTPKITAGCRTERLSSSLSSTGPWHLSLTVSAFALAHTRRSSDAARTRFSDRDPSPEKTNSRSPGNLHHRGVAPTGDGNRRKASRGRVRRPRYWPALTSVAWYEFNSGLICLRRRVPPSPNAAGTLLNTSFRRGSQFNHCERRFVLCQQLCDWAENEGSDDEKSRPIGHRRIYRSNLAVAQLERFTLGTRLPRRPLSLLARFGPL